MASQLTRENTRFYIGRREINGEIEEVYHMNEYNRQFTTEDNFQRTDGFNEARTANILAARFNDAEKLAAEDLGLPVKYHYFTYKKDDQVSTTSNYEVPVEEVKEETPTEEGTKEV